MHQIKESSSTLSQDKVKKNVKANLNVESQLKSIFVLPLESLKMKMWSNTRTCVSFVGAVWNTSPLRGFKTAAVCASTKSSAQPGYVSEDKILQIKQHQNDYAKQYPSVTLILNKTMTDESRAALEKWKQERIAEMGQEEFDRFYEGEFYHPLKIFLRTTP